jgi:hypothetical protein
MGSAATTLHGLSGDARSLAATAATATMVTPATIGSITDLADLLVDGGTSTNTIYGRPHSVSGRAHSSEWVDHAIHSGVSIVLSNGRASLFWAA